MIESHRWQQVLCCQDLTGSLSLLDEVRVRTHARQAGYEYDGSRMLALGAVWALHHRTSASDSASSLTSHLTWKAGGSQGLHEICI